MSRSVAPLLMLLIGCVDPTDAGEAVPSNAIGKSDLAGDWLTVQTTLSVSPEVTWSFEGEQSVFFGTKLRWEVQEHHLVGYESFEIAPGLDVDALGGTEPTDESAKTGYIAPGTRCFEAKSGAEVDCLPNPESHTRGHAGEAGVVCRDPQGNDIACFPYRGAIVALYPILRHFNQRAEGDRRVVDDSGPWYAREFIEVDWSVNLIEEPYQHIFLFLDSAKTVSFLPAGANHREAFHSTREDGELRSFDFVNRIFVEPPYQVVGEGESAYKQYQCIFSDVCSAGEVRVRTAYRKVDRSRDFEPREYGELEHARFPMFRREHYGFDPYRGATVTGRVQLAHQFPLWKEIFRRDAEHRIVRTDTGEPETIPYAEREIEPIRFYLTGEWPTDLVPTIEDTIADYDRVMRQAVGLLRESDPSTVGDVVLLHYNGYRMRVDATSHEKACEALEATGEARMSTLTDGRAACEFVDYAPSRIPALFDRKAPRDVEWIRDATLETAALGDLTHHAIHWVASPQAIGPLGYGPSLSDPETAETVFVTANIYGASLDQYATQALDTINLHNGRVRLEDFVRGHVTPNDDATRSSFPEPYRADAFLETLKEQGERPRAEAAQILLGEKGAARLQSRIELGNPPSATSGAGTALFNAALDASPRLLDLFLTSDLTYPTGASSFDELPPDQHPREWAASVERAAARFGRACAHSLTLAEFYDDAIVADAAKYRDLPSMDLAAGGPAWRELRRGITREVLTHELGHTFGLRHNFKASHDATNYPDAYWDLRKETLAEASEIADFAGMIALDTRTEAQKEAGMDALAGSSVMDYVGRFNNQTSGLGRYDIAALLGLYAGVTEVFDVDPADVPPDFREEIRAQSLSKSRTAMSVVTNRHYTQMPYLLGGSLDEGLARLRSRKWVSWEALEPLLASADPSAPIPVPYEVCTDSEHGYGDSCYAFDAGADDLEIARDLALRYELEYGFTDFRRDRADFRSNTAQFTRLLLRYFMPLRNVYQQGMLRLLSGLGDYSTLRDGLWFAGATVGYNQLSRVLWTPEYGTYQSRDGSYCRHTSYETTPDTRHSVDMGPGRRLDASFEPLGAFGGMLMTERGHRVDRRAAMFALTVDWLSPYSLSPPLTDHAIGWSEGYGDAVERELTARFLGDSVAFGPRLAGGEVRFTPVVDITSPDTYGTPPDGCVLDVALDDRERRIELLYAAVYLRDNYTLAIQHRALVFRVGSSEEPPPPPGGEVVSFTDPDTGIVYGALRFANPSDRPSLAEQLIVRGRTLANEMSALPEGDPERERLRGKLAGIVRDAEYLRSTIHLLDDLAITGLQ